MTDMSPSQLWTRYVRYIGAGAVAAAGIFTLIRSLPVMIQSFRIGAHELRGRVDAEVESAIHPGQARSGGGEDSTLTPRTARDLPLKAVGIGILAIALVLTFLPAPFAALGDNLERMVAAVCVVVFAFFFVTVASRIVGLVGVTSNPTSGMTIAALLGTAGVFLVLGWTDLAGKAGALTVGCVVAIAASIAGDTSQDLKTGYLLGATPRMQQLGQFIGAWLGPIVVIGVIFVLDKSHGLGSETLPAPQAQALASTIDGIMGGDVPAQKYVAGAILGGILSTVMGGLGITVGLGFYLPFNIVLTYSLGTLARELSDRFKGKDWSDDVGIPVAAGLIVGEALVGVGNAIYAVLSAA